VRYSFILSLLVSLPCWTQTAATGRASTGGPCSVANTGSDNKIQINCGIGREQGEKMLAILNKILANRIDSDAVMAKLDEILHAVNPNLPKKAYFCNGGWTSSGPGVNTAMQMNTSFDEDPSLAEMIKLANAGQNEELLKACTSQIESEPDWLTPRLFCAIAYGGMANKVKAQEMLDTYNARKGPAYEGDDLCKQLSDAAHSRAK
jgi:hypothetical protein